MMLKNYLAESKVEVEAFLQDALQTPCKEYKILYDSMNYSLLMGGKRIRPILTKIVLDELHVDYKQFLPSICAIELIHSYSLVHDDLPAMDNDDYRRGKLTNHKVYGDGMAVLAGDGLLTYAFEMVMNDANTTDAQKVSIARVLSHCAGPAGMVGGQAFDLLSEGTHLSLDELKVLHKGKTGALFAVAVEIGLILGNVEEKDYASFMEFANYLGLLFQITDDILDVTGTLEELGKQPGSDENAHKATYVSILGLDGAKEKALEAAVAAKKALEDSSYESNTLVELTDYLLNRTN